MQTKKLVINIVKLGLAIGIIGYLVFTGKLDFSQIPQALAHPLWIELSLLIIISQSILTTVRWKLLLYGLGVREKFWNLLNFTWIGMLFNNVMLGSVGGDVIKILYVVRHFPTKKAITGMTVLLDRVLGLYCMLLLVFVFLWLAPPSLQAEPAIQHLRHGISLFVLGSFIVGPLFFSKRLRRLLPLRGVFAELADAIQSYRDCKRYVFAAFLITFLCHFGMVVIFYLLARALSGDQVIVDFKTMAFVAPAGMVTTAIPLAPAGLGVGQVAFSQLFHWVGSTIPTLGANTITLFQLLAMAANLLGIFAYIFHRPQSREANLEEPGAVKA